MSKIVYGVQDSPEVAAAKVAKLRAEGKLPPQGAARAIAAKRADPNTVSVATCQLLGDVLHLEPCHCGAMEKVAVHACQAPQRRRHSGEPGLCVPLSYRWKRIKDIDARRAAQCCEACEFYQSSAATPDRHESEDPHDPNQSVEP